MSEQVTPEAVETSTTPETPTDASPEVTPETSTDASPEATPEVTPVVDDFSEEELQAAIDAALAAYEKPTEPVSFPKKEEVNAELDSEIQALLKRKDSELEEARRSLQEKQSQSEQIESAW